MCYTAASGIKVARCRGNRFWQAVQVRCPSMLHHFQAMPVSDTQQMIQARIMVQEVLQHSQASPHLTPRTQATPGQTYSSRSGCSEP